MHVSAEYLKAVISPLLVEPSELNIDVSTDDRGVFLQVQVAKQDMGSLLGKGGETIKGIRTIMRVFASRNAMSIAVKVVEPKGAPPFYKNRVI